MTLNLDAPACKDLERLSQLEWLETNGLGGFSSGTVSGLRTRRYHGLFIPALKPPLERKVLLASQDEFVRVDGTSYPLSANQYPDVVHPDGYTNLTGFRLDSGSWPTWTYRVGSVLLEREVFMVHGENTLVVRYRLLEGKKARIEIRPLLAYRDYHAFTHANDVAKTQAKTGKSSVSFQLYDCLPELHIGHSKGKYRHEPDWYRNFDYALEKARGLDHQEDLFTPGCLKLDCMPDQPAGFVASLAPRPFSDADALAAGERKRRENLQAALHGADPVTRRLLVSADQFIVKRGTGQRSVIAGYPWFGDWGRDTLISIPGLCLTAGRTNDARQILDSFAQHVSEGMIPNRFPDGDEVPEYNTIDASLWFFHAAYRYLEVSADRMFIGKILPILEGMVEAHLAGTRYGIKASDDGLLAGGEKGVQLTWMDAKVGDWVVTPRIGKPVEINALWYGALRAMQAFEKKLGRALESMAYARRADKVKDNYAKTFWNEERGCLFDVIQPDGTPDPAIRPNQLFALSLPHRLLSTQQEQSVLNVVTRELLTPMGLRSLAPGEPDYTGHYGGGPLQRDGSYHQGTVWSWPIGAYVDAYLNVHGTSEKTKAHLREILLPLVGHLDEAGLNSVSEIFDGEAPHAPRGCFAQAWGVAELLRSWQNVAPIGY